MKRILWLLATLLCSATLLFAGDKPKSDMTGWICNDKCVTQTTGKATCDASCTDSSGNVVFVDDQGNVSKISNEEMAKPLAGKKVKMKATRDQDTGMLAIQNIVEYRGP